MKTVPTFVVLLNDRGREIYGRGLISVSLGCQMQGGEMCWQSHICLLSRESIFEKGATPAAAFEATMTRMELDTKENLAKVLGIVEAA